MEHAMIDLETLGVSPDSVFLSVGIIEFDINTGEMSSDTLYERVSLKSAQGWDRKIDSDTLQWWMTQRPDILREMFIDAIPLMDVLVAITNFIKINGIKYVWGNSASFDLGILNHTYKAMALPQPWEFRNERCYRTVTSLFPELGQHITKGDNAHHPLVDCEYQIRKLCYVWEQINLGRNSS